MKNYLIAIFNAIHWPFRRHLTGDINGRTLVLDNMRISNAKVINCRLIYGGGWLHWENVHCNGCHWEAFGKAANTITLLHEIYKSDPDFIIKTVRGDAKK